MTNPHKDDIPNYQVMQNGVIYPRIHATPTIHYTTPPTNFPNSSKNSGQELFRKCLVSTFLLSFFTCCAMLYITDRVDLRMNVKKYRTHHKPEFNQLANMSELGMPPKLEKLKKTIPREKSDKKCDCKPESTQKPVKTESIEKTTANPPTSSLTTSTKTTSKSTQTSIVATSSTAFSTASPTPENSSKPGRIFYKDSKLGDYLHADLSAEFLSKIASVEEKIQSEPRCNMLLKSGKWIELERDLVEKQEYDYSAFRNFGLVPKFGHF